MLSIKNIDVLVDNKQVLNNFSLDIDDGSIHVIMGPNGTGKSTLSKVIMGSSDYIVNSGDLGTNSRVLLHLSSESDAEVKLIITAPKQGE